MIEITDKNIGALTGTFLIEFYAAWCGKCQKGLRELEAFEAETGIPTGKADLQKNPKILNRFITNGLPLYVLMKDGKPVKRVVGLCDLRKEFL